MGVATQVGKRMLINLGSDDAKFASEPQFRAVPDPATGEWAIHREGSAVNQTYINGRPISVSDGVTAGAVISIGPAKLKMTVRFEDVM